MSIDIRRFVQAAIENEASDLLLSVGSVPALRVEGGLRPLKTPPLTREDMQAMLAAVSSEAQREQLAQRGAIDFVVESGVVASAAARSMRRANLRWRCARSPRASPHRASSACRRR
ncbi:hypothetical protein ACNOYE_13615 [Nannocystaceae bacterium ST9]